MYKILAKTLFVGKKLVFLPSCHSTNEFASELVKRDKNVDGTIVVTNEQTSGKGQRGNVWESEPNKNLTFSIILNPRFLKVASQFDLNIAISLGVQDYLKSIDDNFLIKWPNDVYHNEKKIGGILIQNTVKNGFIENSIVGIGINVNQSSFILPKASSLSIITGLNYNLPEVLADISHNIEWRFIQLKKGAIKEMRIAYLDHLLGYRQERKFKDYQVFTGVIEGLNTEGQLQIRKGKELLSYSFKEVEFL